MHSQMLSPAEYQTQAAKWQAQYGGRPAGAHEMILRNSDSLEKVKTHSLAWAEEYINGFDLEGWTLMQEVEIEESFAGHLLLARFTLANPSNPPLTGENVYGKGPESPGAKEIRSVPPMHRDNGLNREIYEGVFSRNRIDAPEPGVLHLYKSWDLEDLDGMGIEIPWEEPEDFDRELPEE